MSLNLLLLLFGRSVLEIKVHRCYAEMNRPLRVFSRQLMAGAGAKVPATSWQPAFDGVGAEVSATIWQPAINGAGAVPSAATWHPAIDGAGAEVPATSWHPAIDSGRQC